jgi:hypothetical protein
MFRGNHFQGRTFIAGTLFAIIVVGRLATMSHSQNDDLPLVGPPLFHVSYAVPTEPRKIELPPLERTIQVMGDLACGSAPTDAAGYERLAQAKFRTIIRVDAIPPDAELARRAGLKVVHLPVRFSGLEQDILPILQAQRQLPGPHYLCCMYGTPRAPAAAALSLRALHGRSLEEAKALLDFAGVGTGNPGIIASLAQYEPPASISKRADVEPFPIHTDVTPTVQGMVELVVAWDLVRRWKGDDLKLSGRESVASLQAAAMKTQNAFDRLARLPKSAEQGKEYLELLQAGRTGATALAAILAKMPADAQASLNDPLRQTLLQQIDLVGSTCSRCHRDYRN